MGEGTIRNLFHSVFHKDANIYTNIYGSSPNNATVGQLHENRGETPWRVFPANFWVQVDL